jgi:hypothetical protein
MPFWWQRSSRAWGNFDCHLSVTTLPSFKPSLPVKITQLPLHLASLPVYLILLPDQLALLTVHLARLPTHLVHLPASLACLPTLLALLPGHLGRLKVSIFTLFLNFEGFPVNLPRTTRTTQKEICRKARRAVILVDYGNKMNQAPFRSDIIGGAAGIQRQGAKPPRRNRIFLL